MKLIVNYPELESDKEEFISRVAKFHAILLIEKIKQLHVNDKNKEKILNLVFENLKDKENV